MKLILIVLFQIAELTWLLARAQLRASLHCAYKISKVFALVRRGCLHYTKRRLRA